MTPPIEAIQFNDMPALRLTAPNGGSVIVLHHGAQIVSWIPANGEERLYLSEKSNFMQGAAIRGGIPVIFPQFGARGPLPKHGFARLVEWELTASRSGDDFAVATFTLHANAFSRQIWPHDFEAEMTVAVSGDRLDVEFAVSNPGTTPLRFTCALHTYLRTREVEEASLEGLRGTPFLDSLKGTEHTESSVALRIDDQIDRIYLGVTRPLILREPHRALGINAENLPDVVVWNPWETLCKSLPDMPDNGFRRMLCVEAAAVANPIELPPGQEWWGRQSLVAL